MVLLAHVAHHETLLLERIAGHHACGHGLFNFVVEFLHATDADFFAGVAVTPDGQGRAPIAGAREVPVVEDFIYPTMKAGAKYEKYLLGTSFARPIIAKRIAEIAQATEFIEAKDDKYDSSIAQGGSNVSGGQKQRLAIARAIAKDPKIFIFDDSFSALDLKTDAALRKALAENVKDSTVIIVAQRISTILHAEQILVLDDGRLCGGDFPIRHPVD